MNPPIALAVAFVTVAVLAGFLLWSRRRRSSDDLLVSSREGIQLAERREPDSEVRASHVNDDQNGAPEGDSHNRSAQDGSPDVATENGNGILQSPNLTASEEGRAAPESSGADLPPEVPAKTPAETDTHLVEPLIGASAGPLHALEETVPAVTAGALPETEPSFAPPDSMGDPDEEPVDGGRRTEPAPLRPDGDTRVYPAPDEGLEMLSQAEARQTHSDEGQISEPGSSDATEASTVIPQETSANPELPADRPYVELEQSAAPVPVPNTGLEAGPADLEGGEATAADPYAQSDSVSQESESPAAIEGLNDLPDAVEATIDEIEAPPPFTGDAPSLAVDNAETTPPAPPPRRPGAYRDRRGSRRAGPSRAHPSSAPARAGAGTVPAEAFLRLSLHPIQHTVKLSLVLARPKGFPEQITLATEGHPSVRAYDDGRYDDTDVPAGATLLGGELRFKSLERFEWLRSSRRVQVFSTTPAEPDLISVSAARAGAEHAILCRASDVGEVRRIAELAGSAPLVSHDDWPGAPTGCAVLSAYCPVRAIVEGVEPSLSTLDPGASITIELSGIPIRASVFAEGHPPLISIDGLPEGAVVSIGGEKAQQSDSGAWVASLWDVPGQHVIDVVPGPSLTYEIAPDPASGEGWPHWDAHALRFGASAAAPWERAEICGAHVMGPSGSVIIAAETHATMVALGMHATAAPLRRRRDAPVSIGAVRGGAVFLLSAWGGRRNQGRVVWLGNPVAARSLASSRPDRFWVETVRNAAARRVPLEGAGEVGRKAWKEAVARARKLARAGR